MYSQDHISSVRHGATPCKHGERCNDNTTAHCMKYSHPKKPCQYGVKCNKTADSAHMKFFSHPFLPPCKNKYNCREVSKLTTLNSVLYYHLFIYYRRVMQNT